jgi:hypothetical protein
MNFDMTRPCDNCPFRTDVKPFIGASRAIEIVGGLDGCFPCHKTTKFDQDEAGPQHVPHDDEQHCAGALIMQLKEGWLGQMGRIAERTGWDSGAMDLGSPVYESREEFIAAHVEAEEEAKRLRKGGDRK